MGKTIDRLMLLAACATGLYLLWMRIFGNILLACGLSFAICALWIRFAHGRGGRMTAAQAQAILERWAFGPDDEARVQILRLLRVDAEDLIYLPRPPAASMSMGDVFSAWKAHRNRSRIVLAAPCRADGRAQAFARTLREPTVEIADAQRLIGKIRRSDLEPPRIPRGRQLLHRLRMCLYALPGHRPWRQSAAFGLLLLPVYWLTGNPAYLFLGIGALFLAGISLRPSRNA